MRWHPDLFSKTRECDQCVSPFHALHPADESFKASAGILDAIVSLIDVSERSRSAALLGQSQSIQSAIRNARVHVQMSKNVKIRHPT